MNVASTEVTAKCNTVAARLQKLLRFVAITGLAMLAMIAVYMATDQPITRSGCGVVFFMLVALAVASVFIAFNFDWWFVGPLLNVGALVSTPALLGRDFSDSLGVAVGIGSPLFLLAVLVYTALRRRRWEDEAGTPHDQRFGLFLEDPVPPEKRRSRITNLSREERMVIKYPAHASIFGLMNAAKKAWTMYDVQRLELEIAKRGAWDLYIQLEGSAYRKTAVGVLDTRPPWLRRTEDRLELWLESRFKDQERFELFLKVAPTFSIALALVLLLCSAALFAMMYLHAGAAEPAPFLEFFTLWATLVGSIHALLSSIVLILSSVVLTRVQFHREIGIFPSRH